MEKEIKLSIKINENKLKQIYPLSDSLEEPTKKEIDKFRKEYPKILMDELTKNIKEYFDIKKGIFEEEFLDQIEEKGIEDFESFKDYGIKITVKKSIGFSKNRATNFWNGK